MVTIFLGKQWLLPVALSTARCHRTTSKLPVASSRKYDVSSNAHNINSVVHLIECFTREFDPIYLRIKFDDADVRCWYKQWIELMALNNRSMILHP